MAAFWWLGRLPFRFLEETGNGAHGSFAFRNRQPQRRERSGAPPSKPRSIKFTKAFYLPSQYRRECFSLGFTALFYCCLSSFYAVSNGFLYSCGLLFFLQKASGLFLIGFHFYSADSSLYIIEFSRAFLAVLRFFHHVIEVFGAPPHFISYFIHYNCVQHHTRDEHCYGEKS